MRYNLQSDYGRMSFTKKADMLMAKGATVDLTECGHKRTLSQNALLHLWFAEFAASIGEPSVSAVKRDVKRHLLGQREVTDTITGETVLADYHTSEMSTAELADFMDRFKAWADTDFGIYLPYKGDIGYEELINHRR